MSNIDIKLKSYDELQFEVMALTTNSYLKDLKIKELQERIDKAIHFITFKGDYLGKGEFANDISYHDLTELFNILKGGNNDK